MRQKGSGYAGPKVRLINVMLDVVKTNPRKFAANYIFTAIDGVALGLIAVATDALFEKAMQFSTGEALLVSVVLAVLTFVALSVISEIASGICNYYGETFGELCTQKQTRRMNERVGRLDCIEFEKAEILDEINSAYIGAVNARQFVNTVMDFIFLYIPYFLIYGIWLYSIYPMLLLIIPLVFLPMITAQIIKARIYVDTEEGAAPLRRRFMAARSYVSDREYVAETRTLGAVSYFMEVVRKQRAMLADLLTRARGKAWRTEMLVSVICTVGYGAVILFLIKNIFDGNIVVSSFASVYSTMNMLIIMGDELFSDRMGELAETYASVRNYIRFLNRTEFLKEGVCTKASSAEIESIELKHVSFTYPSSTSPAVCGISITLTKGKTLALVGENGSGKTTLSKLILGLYSPDEGQMIYHGAALQGRTNAVFQDFGRYRMSLRDNLLIGVPDRQGGIDERKALSDADIDLDSRVFPDGLETVLSREFGGTDISGGQWQHVAIARAMVRGGELTVLDEPTSAMDPMTEQRLYESFLHMTDGIGVIVTHRLGLARKCPRIAVMENGRIAAVGSHEELLESCEYYREMWGSQAQGYTS